MNLDHDDDTAALIDEATRVLERAAPLERLHHDGDAATGGAPTWATLVGAGWSDLGTPVVDGDLDLAVAAEVFRAAGRQLLTEQYTTSAFVMPAVAAHGPDTTRAEVAERLGTRPALIAGDGRTPGLVTTADGGHCFGADEGPADLYRLSDTGSGTLTLDVLDGGEITVTPVAGLSRGVATVTVAGARWRPLPLAAGADALARIERHAMVVHSAALVGVAERALTATRDHVADRHQFGVPVGSFQAVKHPLADLFTAAEMAWSAVLCAAVDGADDHHGALVARSLAASAAMTAARTSAQLHGGIGFTWESDVHLVMKAALDGTSRFCSPDAVADELGESLLAEVEPC